jgi:hypothetical protein
MENGFIDKPYGHSLLPSLFSILEGRHSIKRERETDIFISLKIR